MTAVYFVRQIEQLGSHSHEATKPRSHEGEGTRGTTSSYEAVESGLWRWGTGGSAGRRTSGTQQQPLLFPAWQSGDTPPA